MYEGHAINGTWLNTLWCETKVPINLPELVGGDVSLPYDPQELPGTKTQKGRDYTLELVIKGANDGTVLKSTNRPEFMTRAFALGTLLFNGGAPFSLGRRLVLTAGEQVTYTLARYVDGYDVDNIAPPIGKAVVRLRMLWPAWYSTPPSLLAGRTSGTSSPGPITPGGMQPTTYVSVTFRDGVDQVLTNTTTGEYIRIIGSTESPITVDAFNRTVRDENGSNVLARARFNGPTGVWMTLIPYENEFTLEGGGTVHIDYRAAY